MFCRLLHGFLVQLERQVGLGGIVVVVGHVVEPFDLLYRSGRECLGFCFGHATIMPDSGPSALRASGSDLDPQRRHTPLQCCGSSRSRSVITAKRRAGLSSGRKWTIARSVTCKASIGWPQGEQAVGPRFPCLSRPTVQSVSRARSSPGSMGIHPSSIGCFPQSPTHAVTWSACACVSTMSSDREGGG